jgi:hypothetical protein
MKLLATSRSADRKVHGGGLFGGVSAVTLGDLLRQRIDTVAGRWVEDVLSAYPADSASLFRREQDPFANPLGHGVREGTRGLLEALSGEVDSDQVRKHLDEIIRIRAVQQLPPSQALSFVFSLKTILRRELPEARKDPKLAQELEEMEARIDRVALRAFDLYSDCREEVSQLRISEVKRQVSWVMEKINRRDGAPDEAPASPG